MTNNASPAGEKILEGKPVIAWWSGGITSAVVCKLCIDKYGLDNVRIVFIDTWNEDDDTYRFMIDCEKWYGRSIERVDNPEYNGIMDVWYKYLSLNVATGAICSTDLKRKTRQAFQELNDYSYQAFGFDCDEISRARAMKKNYPDSRPIFPLISDILLKGDCLKIIQDAGVAPPRAYEWGFNNNNCLKTGCVQGGIGYWQKMQNMFPDKFLAMAKVEHDLTDLKGEPVTMLKDQSKHGGLVFLKPHPAYPKLKDISMMKGRPSKPLMECNGFCGINDLSKRSKTEKEINYQQTPSNDKEATGI